DPHHEPGRDAGEEQRPERKAGERGAVLAGCPPCEHERSDRGDDRGGDHHRPGHVDEEREVPAVGTDEEERHAPGFQTMSMRSRSTAPLAIRCAESAGGPPTPLATFL